tara:strand:- start:710 stop:1048 length:339 start_codon:yes stop_codon:yes gene_type:complete
MEEKTKIKQKKPSITALEIDLRDEQDLIDLSSDEKFINFILMDTYKSLKIAINSNLSKVSLFDIFNLSILVEVKKSNYIPILEKIMDVYELAEDYEECSKIKNLIKKLNEKV